ncbi:phage protein NinX family protein [Paraburkholderia sediminicola]|uniref:phage protein NinX family protein n=1 Tax=Paraburkholderia sediminicola TaxID=458836 RepID=UPI0038BDAB6A
MYVADLKGPWLDYWVARAEGTPDLLMPAQSEPVLKFSSDPALAQPIIDRERIFVGLICDAVLGNQAIASVGEVDGRCLPSSEDSYCLGDTALEAAMRCYVYRKFGPEVA